LTSTEEKTFENKLVYNDNILISNQVKAFNDTTLHQSLSFTDHESFYHDIWQSVAYNKTYWRQSLYYGGEEVLSFDWDSEKGMKFVDEELASENFKFVQLVDVKNSNVREEVILKDNTKSFELKFQQNFNLRFNTWNIKVFDALYGMELYTDTIDLKKLLEFKGKGPLFASELPKKKEEEYVEWANDEKTDEKFTEGEGETEEDTVVDAEPGNDESIGGGKRSEASGEESGKAGETEEKVEEKPADVVIDNSVEDTEDEQEAKNEEGDSAVDTAEFDYTPYVENFPVWAEA